MENLNDKNFCLRIARRVFAGIGTHDGDIVTEEGYALVKNCTEIKIEYLYQNSFDATFILSCTWAELYYPKWSVPYNQPFPNEGPYSKTYPAIKVAVKESIPENLDEIFNSIKNQEGVNTLIVKEKPFGRTWITESLVSQANQKGLHIIYVPVLEMMKNHMVHRYKWFE